MPMPSYQVFCSTPTCRNLALYKIAAEWSDGVVRELKTYGLCCEDCRADWLARTRAKQAGCHLTAGETLQPAGVYRLARGQRDLTLQRVPELEGSE